MFYNGLGLSFASSLTVDSSAEGSDDGHEVLENVLLLVRDLVDDFDIAPLVLEECLVGVKSEPREPVLVLNHDERYRLILQKLQPLFPAVVDSGSDFRNHTGYLVSFCGAVIKKTLFLRFKILFIFRRRHPAIDCNRCFSRMGI